MTNKGLPQDELFELVKPDGGRFKAADLKQAYGFCKKIATGHYENFPVGSVLIPKDKRKHIFAIYAFARLADDIADELTDMDPDLRLGALSAMDSLLRLSPLPGNPVFMALQSTMKVFDIPELPLKKLLIAFRRDVCFSQPETLFDLEDYCLYSANPVGELVLRVFGLYNNRTAKYSDMICTGLQLVNFWQDISVDFKKGRIYIPHKILEKYGLSQENLQDNFFSAKLERCLNELYDYTEKFFIYGSSLIPLLHPFRLKSEITAVIEGGSLVLGKLRKLGPAVIGQRPDLGASDMLRVLLYSFFYKRVVV